MPKAPTPTPRPEPLLHGGSLDEARRRFPAAPLPWIDLSTGINPHAYPIGAIRDDAWRRLPEDAEQAALEAAAARAYEVAPGRQVVAAPGTQALIQHLARIVPARRVAVLGFGYEEHPAAWRAAGAEVAIVDTVENLGEADVAVVVNPNNPDGRAVPAHALASLADRLARRGGTLVVDEAFAEVADPALSLCSALPPRGAVVLRSFGKFFGLAGLRLGFAVAGHDLARALRTALGPWAVSGPALAVATRALQDRAWRNAEIERLRADAERLDALLAGGGLTVLGGTLLFRLVDHPQSATLHERLGAAGILVRHFPARPTWLRFGLPADPDAWTRLAAALEG